MSWTPLRLLIQMAIDRPKLTLLSFALITVLGTPGLLRLKLRTDGQALVPREHAAVVFDTQLRDHFNLRDTVVIVVETRHPDGIYNQATLGIIQDLTESLLQWPELEPGQVTSLATENRDRVFPGTVEFRPFLQPFPNTPELMAKLRGDVEAVDLLFGTLVSNDRRATAILAGLRLARAEGDNGDRTRLFGKFTKLVKSRQTEDDRVSVVGAPIAEALLGIHILEDLAVLLPFSIAIIALILWLGCRRLWGVLLGMAEIGACLAWTFGLMGWLGVPVFLTTAVLPVVLTTIGLADEIHIFWRYQQVLETTREPHPVALRATMRDMARPIVLTSLTTAIGFLSFLSSPLSAVKAFGIFAPLGIMFCMFWSLTVVPAALKLLSPDHLRRPRQSAVRSKGPLLERLLAPVMARPRTTLLSLALMSLIIGSGASRLLVQDSWIDGFSRGSQFRRDTDRVNEHFYGTHLLLVELKLPPLQEKLPEIFEFHGPAGPYLVPQNLLAIGDFENYIRNLAGVGGALGPHAHIVTTSYLWRSRREEKRAIPDKPANVALVIERFDEARGEHRRSQVIDDERQSGVVTIFLKDANYLNTAAIMASIEAYAAEHLAPLGFQIGFGGDVAVSQTMIPIIVKTQIYSLLLALAGAFLVIVLMHRSLKTGLLLMVPAFVAVMWAFGFMGWFAIPLGVATSMFCAITLGIGVDFSIHFFESRQRACENLAPERRVQDTSVAVAIRESGPAIIADTFAIVAGFGLLMLSQVPANARLGFLVALALLANCLLTLAGMTAWFSRGSKEGKRPPEGSN